MATLPEKAFSGFMMLVGSVIFGIVIGTYSSIFLAAPFLILLNLRPGKIAGDDEGGENAKGTGKSGSAASA